MPSAIITTSPSWFSDNVVLLAIHKVPEVLANAAVAVSTVNAARTLLKNTGRTVSNIRVVQTRSDDMCVTSLAEASNYSRVPSISWLFPQQLTRRLPWQ